VGHDGSSGTWLHIGDVVAHWERGGLSGTWWLIVGSVLHWGCVGSVVRGFKSGLCYTNCWVVRFSLCLQNKSVARNALPLEGRMYPKYAENVLRKYDKYFMLQHG
jgi:hypothetical protein